MNVIPAEGGFPDPSRSRFEAMDLVALHGRLEERPGSLLTPLRPGQPSRGERRGRA